MPSAIHQIAIAKILRQFPTAKTRGLLKEIRKAMDPLDAREFKGFGVIPDAFIVDRERQCVTVIEVEGAHPLNDEKMELYCDLWWSIDGTDWDMRLITVDRWGTETARIDMADFALDKIFHDARSRGFKPTPDAMAYTRYLLFGQIA